jgi:acyl carrier protein
MTEQDIFDKLLPLVREVTGARSDQVRMDSGLMEDLGAESLDLLDLVFLIEETFQVTIVPNEFEQEVTARLPGGVFQRDGLLTEEAVTELHRVLPEVPPEQIYPGMAAAILPAVLPMAVFVHLIQRKLAQAGDIP